MEVKVFFPVSTEGIKKANMSTWHKQVGEQVQKGEVICEATTGKADVEVEAPETGTLKEILVAEGAVVKER